MKTKKNESVSKSVVNGKVSVKNAKIAFKKHYNSRFRVLEALNECNGIIDEVTACYDILGVKKLEFTFFDHYQYLETVDKGGNITIHDKAQLCSSHREIDGKIYGYNPVELRPDAWLSILIKAANRMQSLRKKYPHASLSTLEELL